jgi:hypothetical protein
MGVHYQTTTTIHTTYQTNSLHYNNNYNYHTKAKSSQLIPSLLMEAYHGWTYVRVKAFYNSCHNIL